MAIVYRPSTASCELDQEKVRGADAQAAEHERRAECFYQGFGEYNQKRRHMLVREHRRVARPYTGPLAGEEHCRSCRTEVHQTHRQLHRLQRVLQTLLHHQAIQPQVHT